MLAFAIVTFAVACRGGGQRDDRGEHVDHPGDRGGDEPAARDDAAAPVVSRLLYPEGPSHSPITPEVVAEIERITAIASRDERVFAKVGDSITATPSFLTCFDHGSQALGNHGTLATTIAHFRKGSISGGSPFERSSLAAFGGAMARDVLEGSPSRLDQELAASRARYALVMLGTNEVRYGRSVDEYGAALWTLVDVLIASGTVPVLSTIPGNNSYAGADARIPTFNRVVRAIAQGRRVPLVDLYRALEPLPSRGLGSDGLHLSAVGHGCALTEEGLQGGYNLRNLVSLEALERVRGAVMGTAHDSDAPRRSGAGSVADPVAAQLPLVDLGDVRTGDAAIGGYACGGRGQPGREIVYRLDVTAPVTIEALVVDKHGIDVDVHLLAGAANGSACLASGDERAVASVEGGSMYVVVDTASAATEGEFLLIVQAR